MFSRVYNGADPEKRPSRRTKYASDVWKRFRSEYEESVALPIPDGYRFHPFSSRRIAQPSLMQRHVAVQVRDRRRIGNWSTTGTGKTLSAILASRVIKAQYTVILCPNAVVGVDDNGNPTGDGWLAVLKNAYPDSRVAVKTLTPTWEPGDGPRYLVLNYETLQQQSSQSGVAALVALEDIDMVVIDEVHFAKQRDIRHMSQRRERIIEMVRLAGAKNPDLAVLGMSATPVINNLQEARSLLEMILGRDLPHIATTPTVANCITVYQELTLIGSRWKANYDQEGETVVPVDITAHVQEIDPKGTTLDFERVLTKSRIPAIVNALRDGEPALIYTHFVDNLSNGIVEPLREACEQANRTVGVYTGQDKTGLQQFLNKEVDVLIAGDSVMTGVDGLQEVCSTLIINSLPWTHAAYLQLRGRLFRQGRHGRHGTGRVVIVVTEAIDPATGLTWSFDRSRLELIQYKRSLADAAVDGVLPDGKVQTQKVLLRRASTALTAFLAQIDNAANQKAA